MSSPTPRTRKPPAIPATITVTLSADVPVLQAIPEIANPWKLQNQALVTLVRVAQGTDPYYATEAAKFLLEYACNEIDRREAKKAELYGPKARSSAAPSSDRDAILAELKGLYAKALGPSQLIVEAEPDSDAAHALNKS